MTLTKKKEKEIGFALHFSWCQTIDVYKLNISTQEEGHFIPFARFGRVSIGYKVTRMEMEPIELGIGRIDKFYCQDLTTAQRLFSNVT